MDNLECALFDDDAVKHVLNEPLELSCQHYVCKSCLVDPTGKELKCRICGKVNTNDLTKEEVSNEAKMKINFNLQRFLVTLEEQLSKSLSDFKNAVVSKKEKIENLNERIEYFKDEIDVRIESLKLQLDIIQEKLKTELDDLKTDMVKNIELSDLQFSKIDVKIADCEKQVEAFRVLLFSDKQKNEELLYENQNLLIKMQKTVDKIKNWDLTVDFYPADVSISEQSVGSLIYSKKYKQIDKIEIEERLKTSIFEMKISDAFALDVCQLPNGYLVSCNSSNFTLYNEKYELVRKITEIDGKPLNSWNLTHNNQDVLYYTDETNNKLIMCDLSFNFKKSTGSKGSGKEDFREPHGVCYSSTNNRVYVCDSGNKRIKVYSAELDCLITHLLEITPFQIKIINNTACVRSYSTFEKPLYFYNLKNFTVKSVYPDTHHPVSIINKHFYQVDYQNECLQCYNSEGLHIDKLQAYDIKTAVHKSPYDGILVQFNGNLLVSSQKQEKIFVI